jgi:hypothetical protein
MTATILASILATFAALSGPPDETERRPPPADVQEGQNFCCNEVNVNTLTGEGCVSIGTENINACSKVLYCGGDYVKIDGTVVCR